MRALWLTGPLGSGKTATAVEVGHRLMDRGVRTAVVDADWLNWVGPDLGDAELLGLLADNLADLARRFASVGVEQLVVARGLLHAGHRAEVERALAGWELTVVRLDVTSDVARARVAGRDAGSELDAMLAEGERIAAAIATAGVEDHVVAPDPSASVVEVADAVLAVAGLAQG